MFSEKDNTKSCDQLASVSRSFLEAGDRGVTLEQLRSFIAVVRCGGFHQAGLLVNRSQSAVTQSIKRLEDCLGCSLLVRTQGRLLGPTEEGRRFFAQALVTLEQVEKAVMSLKKPVLEGRVKLGVPDDFVIENLYPSVSRCLASHPSLEIEITSTVSSALQKLYQQKKLDLVVFKTTSHPEQKSIDGEVLRAERLCWVASRPIKFDDLNEVPLVVFPEGCAYRRAAIGALDGFEKRWHISYTSAAYENIQRAIKSGLGIGILSHSAIRPEYIVLSNEHGFPELPMVQLVLAVRSDCDLFRRVANDLIVASYSS